MKLSNLLTIVGLCLLTARPSMAQEKEQSLKGVVAELAAKVKAAAAALKPAQTSVRLGVFSPSQDALLIGIGYGAIETELVDALKSFISVDAALELSGQVLLVEDPNNKEFKIIRIIPKLTDRSGDEPTVFKELTAEFKGFIRKATDLARIGVVTVGFKPDGEYNIPPGEAHKNDIKERQPPKPGVPPAVKAFIEQGTLVRTSAKGKYAVEILSGKDPEGTFKPLPVKLDDAKNPGLPVVQINKGEYYRVRVKNDDSVEIAVFLELDGIDQFTFSENRTPEGRPKYSSWIVQPGEEIVIMGWHKNVGTEEKVGEVFGFLTTKAGEGAASKFPTQSLGKVGTICVSIAHTKPLGSKSANGGDLETTTGAPIKVKQKEVKRSIAEPHEFIAVRYGR